MHIVILDDYQDAVRHLDAFKRLAAGQPAHTIHVETRILAGAGAVVDALREAEAVVLIRERTALTREIIQQLPHLKVIIQTGRVARDHTAHIDVPACTERGIVILEGASDAISAAELTWALILAAQRRLPRYMEHLKQGAWQQNGLGGPGWPANFGIGRVLRGQTLGIWGYGRIGRMLAEYGRAFGMQLLAWGRERSLTAAAADGVPVARSRTHLFEESDIVSIHLRQGADTVASVQFEDLVRMKPTALFVNTSRAGLVEPGALARALKQGRPGMAAMDVYATEPIGPDNELLQMENCFCSPHIGYVEANSYEILFGSAFQNFQAYQAGDDSSVVNPEALR